MSARSPHVEAELEEPDIRRSAKSTTRKQYPGELEGLEQLGPHLVARCVATQEVQQGRASVAWQIR
jgi:hypothetical protein